VKERTRFAFHFGLPLDSLHAIFRIRDLNSIDRSNEVLQWYSTSVIRTLDRPKFRTVTIQKTAKGGNVQIINKMFTKLVLVSVQKDHT